MQHTVLVLTYNTGQHLTKIEIRWSSSRNQKTWLWNRIEVIAVNFTQFDFLSCLEVPKWFGILSLPLVWQSRRMIISQKITLGHFPISILSRQSIPDRLLTAINFHPNEKISILLSRCSSFLAWWSAMSLWIITDILSLNTKLHL